MTDNRTDFFNAIAAQQTAQGWVHFADNGGQATGENWVSVLGQYGLLEITGPDSLKFLQGQTSCDTSQLLPERALPGSYCTPKGRAISSFLLAELAPERYGLRMALDLVTSTRDTLGKYIVFSKATQRDASDNCVLFGLAGNTAATLLDDYFAAPVGGRYHCRQRQGVTAVQIDEDGQLFECWVSADHAMAWWQHCIAALTAVSSERWELAMIRAGLAEVTAATRDAFVPQMLNYDLTGHVNFKKGCYTGQEVVARMHYRGKSKRRLYRAGVTAEAISMGDPLFTTDSDQSVGEVVRFASVGEQQWELLAVVSNSDVNRDAAITIGKKSTPLTLLPHPYAITTEDAS